MSKVNNDVFYTPGELYRQNSGEASAPPHKLARVFFADNDPLLMAALAPRRQRLGATTDSLLSKEVTVVSSPTPALGEGFKPDSWTRTPKRS